MRLLLAFSLFGMLAACSGDSSSVMSVWTDDSGGAVGSAGSGTGGRVGSTTGAGGAIAVQGGTGGDASAGTGGSGVVTVRGGTRDVATAQCVTTGSGGGCPVDGTLLECFHGPCGSALANCFQGTTGPCADYATCMFACPCDTGRSDCENACFNDKAVGNATCKPHIYDLISCWSAKGCSTPICLIN